MSSSQNNVHLEEGSTYKGNKEHNKSLIALTVVMFIVYCISLVIPALDQGGLLPTSVGNASDMHLTELTPAGWAFSIWIVIFIWQMLWVIYAVVNLCRRNDQGPVYLNPPIINIAFVVAYTVGQVATIAWYFVWTYLIVWASFIIIAIIPVCVWTCIALLTRGLVRYRENFSSRVDLWLYRILVLNGLSIFGTWTALATHVNLGMMIIYDFGATIDVGSTIALVIVLLLVIAYAFLDLFLWDRYLRYNVLSYPVVIWATSAILDSRLNEDDFSADANFIIAAILLSVGCVAFVLKAVLLIVRSVRENQRQIL